MNNNFGPCLIVTLEVTSSYGSSYTAPGTITPTYQVSSIAVLAEDAIKAALKDYRIKKERQSESL